MKILIKLTLLVAFSVATASAQKNIDPTPEDVVLAKKIRTTYDKDDVAVLESNENISFELNKNESKVVVNHSIKELLMNINHRANIQKYEFYDSESKIETFNLKFRNDKNTNNYVADEFYKDNDLFYNDARVKYMAVNFPIQGYTYNYELEKKYDDVKYFTSLYFNDEFPVIKKQIIVTVPEWLNVELKEFNFEGANVTKSQTKDSKNNTVFTYTLNNVPALYKEEEAPGRSYIYPHILIIAKSYKLKGKDITLFNSTADLYKWYKSLVDLMKDDTSVLKSKVAELTATAKTDEEKIKIENWVNDKIKAKLNVVRKEMSLVDAQKIGAQMEFGAKYPETVSIYFIEENNGNQISKEFCGGPHVANTGELGSFKILKEEAISQGTRRIKAILS
jgi:hypothetical protein